MRITQSFHAQLTLKLTKTQDTQLNPNPKLVMINQSFYEQPTLKLTKTHTTQQQNLNPKLVLFP